MREANAPSVSSSANAEHYAWGEGCDGWHLVKSEGLSVIQELMPPGTSEVRHRHARSRQYFFVLHGGLTLEAEHVRRTLRANEGLEIPPGVAHQVTNESSEPASFLVISQPPSHGDRELAPLNSQGLPAHD